MEMNTQKILNGAVFLYQKRTRLNSPRVKSYIFDKTKRATGVFGHGLCNKTECKIDTKGKHHKLHWFVILDMRIPAHVRILKQLCPEFETLNVDVPILLCASHFSEKTFYNFLETGAFPENFELNSNAQKELEKEPSKRKQKTCFIQKNVQKELKKKPSTRKEKTCFIQKKSIHKPSIYIRIAQHMKTAYSEFRKKGNPVWNLLALEVPFAINPREKLPTGRVITPEETDFEETDSDDDLYKLVDEQESLACGTKKNENNFQDNDEHDAMTKQNETVETDLSEKVSDNNIEDETVETDLSDKVFDNEEEDIVLFLEDETVETDLSEKETFNMTGRGKGGKGLGKGGAKRHRKVLRDNIQGITKLAIRRLARRGGVKRISGLIYIEDETVETDLSEKVSDNNIKTGDEEQDETGEQDNVSDNEEEDETGEQDNVSDNEEEDETGEPDNVSDNEEEDETGETGEPTNEDWKKMSNEDFSKYVGFFKHSSAVIQKLLDIRSQPVSDNEEKDETVETGEQDNVSDNEEEDETGDEKEDETGDKEEDETGETDNVSDNDEEDISVDHLLFANICLFCPFVAVTEEDKNQHKHETIPTDYGQLIQIDGTQQSHDWQDCPVCGKMFVKPFFAILHCFKVHPAIYDFEEMGIRPYNFELEKIIQGRNEEVKICDQLLGLNEQSIQIYQSQLKVNKDVAKIKIQTLERQLQKNKRNYFKTIAKLNEKNVELIQECERLKKTDNKRKRKEQTFQKGNERKKTKLTDF